MCEKLWQKLLNCSGSLKILLEEIYPVDRTTCLGLHVINKHTSSGKSTENWGFIFGAVSISFTNSSIPCLSHFLRLNYTLRMTATGSL